MSEEPQENRKKRVKKLKNEFIDDEAELSGDDEVSEDELELSDDDQVLEDLVDKDAQELDSEEEEEVRGLYHKQLESEDKRAVLLLQEQLEDKDVSIGERRRRKFRWQTKEFMENALRRHYDPDDDDSQDCDDDEDEVDYSEMKIGLRRPTAESILIGSTRLIAKRLESKLDADPADSSTLNRPPVAGPSTLGEDSNSNSAISRLASGVRANATSDLTRFVFRDRETVEALSTKETVVLSREEKDRNIQRELKRVIQSKSIFDQLYS